MQGLPLYIDIETGPDSRPGAAAEIAANAKPPANYKNAETIEKWRADKAQDLWQKTSLDAAYGYIACISCALDDGEIVSIQGKERDVLLELFHFIQQSVNDSAGPLVFVGHNIRDFDIPFINRRAMVNRIKPPKNFPTITGKQPYIFDTMLEWSGYRDRISQDNLCKALGIEGKPDTGPTGATVWEYLAKGDIESVVEYNRDDVSKVRQIYKRLTFAED